MLCLITFTSGIFIPFSTYAFDYVLGTGTYSEPTTSKPAKGAAVTDTNFHTTIRRITDRATDGYSGTRMTPYYGRYNPENADGTRVLLAIDEAIYYIYNASSPYNVVRGPINPATLGMMYAWSYGSLDAQWDATDPDTLYYFLTAPVSEIQPTYRACLMAYHPSTNTAGIIYDFKNDYPTAYVAKWSTEGEPSKDSRYWSLWIYDSTTLIAQIVLDKDYYGHNQGKVIHAINNPACGGDYITTSPDGDYSFVAHGPCGNLWGMAYSFANWPNSASIAVSAHSDTSTFYTPGTGYQEGYFGQDGQYDCIGSTEYDSNGYQYRYNDLCGGISSPYCGGFEFSGHNWDKPGWGTIRNYQKLGGVTSWFDHEIFMIEQNKDKCTYKRTPRWTGTWQSCSTPARIWRVAHSRDAGADTNGGGYWAYWGTINRKGTRVYFGSNWDTPGGDVDTYVIELPDGWYKDLTGNTPPTVSASATPTSGQSPLTVKFTGSANDPDGTIVSYRWYFGDGSTSTEQNPTHIYNKGGLYTTTLEVIDNGGATNRAFVSISVGDSVPPASPPGVTVK